MAHIQQCTITPTLSDFSSPLPTAAPFVSAQVISCSSKLLGNKKYLLAYWPLAPLLSLGKLCWLLRKKEQCGGENGNQNQREAEGRGEKGEWKVGGDNEGGWAWLGLTQSLSLSPGLAAGGLRLIPALQQALCVTLGSSLPLSENW